MKNYIRILGMNNIMGSHHMDKKPLAKPLQTLPDLDQKLTWSKIEEMLTNTLVQKSTHGMTIQCNQVASNSPIEDYYDIKKTKFGTFVAVYDGHGGPKIAKLLSRHLANYVDERIKINMDPDEIENALVSAFEDLDQDILSGKVSLDPWPQRSFWEKLFGNETTRVRILDRIYANFAGSCAIVAYIQNDDIYICCTGDSRAVMAKPQLQKNEAIPLSIDQNLYVEEEFERILVQHPNEDVVYATRDDVPRIMGSLMCSRSFGDAGLKYPVKLVKQLEKYGFKIPAKYETPPYVIATPKITRTKADYGSHLVLASDGLWDELTNDEVADIISKGTSSPATDLIISAIGGLQQDYEHIVHSLSLSYPTSRKYRDDITVLVVSFDDSMKENIDVCEKQPLNSIPLLEWASFL